MMSGFNFLIDFVNVQEWSRKALHDLMEKYQVADTVGGQEHGHDVWFRANKDVKKWLYLHPQMEPGHIEITLPEFIATEEEVFPDVVNLQDKWREIIIRTSQEGPDLEFLNSISSRVSQWEIAPTGNKFKPRVEIFRFHYGNLETTLDFMFLDAVLLMGDAFPFLAVCRQCEKVFMFRRRSAKFCPGRKCRDQFNNRRKIESGYLAAHQAKGRNEKPLIYIR